MNNNKFVFNVCVLIIFHIIQIAFFGLNNVKYNFLLIAVFVENFFENHIYLSSALNPCY